MSSLTRSDLRAYDRRIPRALLLAATGLAVVPLVAPAQNTRVVIAPATGYSIAWDGNNGDYFTAASPAPTPENDALAGMGAVAIGSSRLDLGVHFLKNVNDGAYGNSHSWIADFIGGDLDPWVGIAFGRNVAVTSAAWGRDNGDATDCCGGNLTDRAGGTYFLQFTQVAAPAADTVETGDPATGWAAIGQLQYRGAGTDLFRHHLRHEYKVAKEGAAISATGIRIKVSSNQTAIDEIEVNPRFVPPVGGEIMITGTGSAALEAADTLGGAWAAVPNAASPFKFSPGSAAQKFYRLRKRTPTLDGRRS